MTLIVKFDETILFHQADKVFNILGGHNWVFKKGDVEISVTRHQGSYGGRQGLYEVAIFKGTGLDLAVPIKGWLGLGDVLEIIQNPISNVR